MDKRGVRFGHDAIIFKHLHTQPATTSLLTHGRMRSAVTVVSVHVQPQCGRLHHAAAATLELKPVTVVQLEPEVEEVGGRERVRRRKGGRRVKKMGGNKSGW